MDFKALREKMVSDQIIGRGIADKKVIEAMRDIPRHEFVPPKDHKHAYEDHPLSIGSDQTISQPYMVALMSQALQLTSQDRVLEIGTGSGYQTAVLARIAHHVDTIERIEELSLRARQTLDSLKFRNINFFVGDGTEIIQSIDQIFNAIMITAAAPTRMEHLLNMLDEGGRLLVPVGSRSSQMLTRFTKTQDGFKEEELCRCVFVPLIGAYGFH